MRTVTFQSVLNWVARRMLGDEANMSQQDANAFVDHINSWTRQAWERFFWPELTPLEQRWYRLQWLVGTTYAAGAEVWDVTTGAYWRALVSNTGNQPGADGTNWQQVSPAIANSNGVFPTPLNPYVALSQGGGFCDIGTVRRITLNDPRIYNGSGEVRFGLSALGIEIPTPAPLSVWVEYRMRPSSFTATSWSSGTPYTAGQTVYYAPSGVSSWAAQGDCYLALTSSTGVTPQGDTTGAWQLVPMPYVLSEAVKRYAYAEALKDDGQNDKADGELAQADGLLDDEWLKVEAQQGQVRRFAVLTPGRNYGGGWGCRAF